MLRSKDRPLPGPSYMTEDQKAEYLRKLRDGNFSRPSGSRPPPPSRFAGLKRTETAANLGGHAVQGRPPLPTSNSMPIMPAIDSSHKRVDSNSSAKLQHAGRPLARPPSATPSNEQDEQVEVDTTVQRRPSVQYIERGTRWMEKQEVRSIRMAMEDMDSEKEKKVHDDAQDEAAELVWKHQNPDAASANPHAPYANPDLRRDYRSHIRKGSYQRSHSQEVVPVISQRSASGSSQESNEMSTMSKRGSREVLGKVSPPSGPITNQKKRTPSGKSYGGLAEAVADDIAKAHRRTSSGSKRILSGEKKMFMHPNDRIWEDPQEEPQAHTHTVEPSKPVPNPQPAYVRKNPFARVRMQAEMLERSRSEPIVTTANHRCEIQKNPPSQSRNPFYTANKALTPTTPRSKDEPSDEVAPKTTPTKDGKEVRGDDIRAATSKSRQDYSPKLPRPTMVSDKPGRPIVSFDKDTRPKEVVLEEKHSQTLPRPGNVSEKQTSRAGRPHPSPTGSDRPSSNTIPQICVDNGQKPPIPTINVPDGSNIPSIVLPEEPDFVDSGSPTTPTINVEPPFIAVNSPVINVSDETEIISRNKPPPQRSNKPPPTRPSPHHAATSPLPRSTPHFTPSAQQFGALCAHCALPIAGRILSAAGERFHPSCFVCHQCHEHLELVAFYPEPEKKREERLERIAARKAGVVSEGMSDDDVLQQECEDGDETLRFYCHLDFHELFSPRCKTCKTPIEGEVIVACGAEFHPGHFFCAQCGDPFDSTTPFVEKDSYAWCVGCHTNRYSSKCRKCRKPVTDTVFKALGYDWHGDCFVCTECNGEFDDGQFFLRGDSQDPVCVRCEAKRLKA